MGHRLTRNRAARPAASFDALPRKKFRLPCVVVNVGWGVRGALRPARVDSDPLRLNIGILHTARRARTRPASQRACFSLVTRALSAKFCYLAASSCCSRMCGWAEESLQGVSGGHDSRIGAEE